MIYCKPFLKGREGMKVISIMNQKGGTGKTTVTLNLAAAYALDGSRVLMMDLDSQGSLTAATCAFSEQEPSTYEVIAGDVKLTDAIKTLKTGLSIVPTDNRLLLLKETGEARQRGRIKRILKGIETDYDYVFIDCPPHLAIDTIMALSASDYAIIPVQTNYLSMAGLAQMMDSIKYLQDKNKALQVGAIVPTFVRKTNLDRYVLSCIREVYPDLLTESHISQSVLLAEAPLFQKDIFSYKPHSKGAKEFTALHNELVHRGI